MGSHGSRFRHPVAASGEASADVELDVPGAIRSIQVDTSGEPPVRNGWIGIATKGRGHLGLVGVLGSTRRAVGVRDGAGLARIRHRKRHNAKTAVFNPGPGRPLRSVLGSKDDAWAGPLRKQWGDGKLLISWEKVVAIGGLEPPTSAL